MFRKLFLEFSDISRSPMIASVRTGVLRGVEAISVDAEVSIGDSLEPSFVIVGLGDSAVRESRERVLSALRYNNYSIPSRILVNLAPAELRKEGSGFDCAIAVGILAASGQLPSARIKGRSFFGELALDGTLRAVRGIVSLAFQAHRDGAKALMIALPDSANAALIDSFPVLPFINLRQLVEYLCGRVEIKATPPHRYDAASTTSQISLDDVRGQESAKRALTIAAAGRHNLLMVGPPGCGKSMLAARLASILPALSANERLEVARIYSAAGLPLQTALRGERPFRAPHHGGSDVGLVGGGSVVRPGEITMAHRGVLFLDEFPEFQRSALEALRSPLESGTISIVRSRSSVALPARFQLVAAMNPCPCGRMRVRGLHCRCSAGAIAAFMRKLSQPILDRIDLHVELEAVPLNDLIGRPPIQAASHAKIMQQVSDACSLQNERQGCSNSELQAQALLGADQLGSKEKIILERAAARGLISARGIVRVMRVARTIADLERSTSIMPHHLSEALSFRVLERYASTSSSTAHAIPS